MRALLACLALLLETDDRLLERKCHAYRQGVPGC